MHWRREWWRSRRLRRCLLLAPRSITYSRRLGRSSRPTFISRGPIGPSGAMALSLSENRHFLGPLRVTQTGTCYCRTTLQRSITTPSLRPHEPSETQSCAGLAHPQDSSGSQSLRTPSTPFRTTGRTPSPVASEGACLESSEVCVGSRHKHDTLR